MRNKLAILAGLALLTFFAVRADGVARSSSQTFDEGAHLVAGVSYWRTGDFRLNPEHPPLLKLFWAIPVALRSDVPFHPDGDAWEKKDHWRLADAFLYDGPVNHFEMLLAARRMNIVLGVALVALIGWWAYRLRGKAAGLLACALAASDPNLAAFAALLSMDLGLALFVTAAGYALWEYTASGARGWFLLAGIMLGLALAAKFSAIVSIAGLVAGAVVYVAAGGTLAVPRSALGPSLKARYLAVPAAFVRLALIAVAIVIAVYAGMNALDWPRGMKQQLVRGEQGDPHFFLDGEISSTGWLRYFPEVLAIKTPPGTLFLAIAALFSVQRIPWREWAFLFVPALIYFFAMVLSGIDIGWRVILPAYPALTVFASRTVLLVSDSRLGRVVAAILLSAAVLPALVDSRTLAYSNGVFVRDDRLLEHLGDSNIDWGQGLKELPEYWREKRTPVIYLSYAGTARPEAYGIEYERLPGWGQFHTPPPNRVDPSGRVFVALSVSNLQGTYLSDPTMYHWLLKRKPVSRTDSSIWLFDLTGDVEAIERVRKMAELK